MGFGTFRTTEPEIMKEGDSRHRCLWCNKMIRVGQQYHYESGPTPFRRDTRFTHWHYPSCREGAMVPLEANSRD